MKLIKVLKNENKRKLHPSMILIVDKDDLITVLSLRLDFLP